MSVINKAAEKIKRKRLLLSEILFTALAFIIMVHLSYLYTSSIVKDIVDIALDTDGSGVLFDQDLNIIAHAKAERIGLNLRDPEVPLSVFAEEITAGIDISGKTFIDLEGRESVAIVRELPNGWYFGLLTPKNAYYHSVGTMMYVLCAIGGVLASILIVILVRIDKKKNRADEESKQKSAFLANMSHEIRTPMNAIIGMTTLGKAAEDINRKNTCFFRIEEASKHLLGVINDILDMSKIEAKKFELSLTEFDFKEMIHRVVNIVNCRFEEKDQRFQVHIDESIPYILIGDDQRLAQVITNLLSNAAKFTPKQGDIELSITSLEKTEEYCTIQVSVTDTGIGISANQQESLFEAFKQAESGISRKYGGTGLGLPISKNIVEMMGGNVWIDSELGQGATFAFKISLKLGMADTIQLSEVDEDIKISEAFCGKRVLLAEDLEINYEIIKSLLEPTHLNIDWAENGVEAVQMFNESQGMYDIVLMDVHMPMMDGYEATRLIRSSNVPRAKTIPIIAMTANVFREDIERCIESGMSDHLGKPIDYKAVITKLHDYLLTEKQSRIAS